MKFSNPSELPGSDNNDLIAFARYLILQESDFLRPHGRESYDPFAAFARAQANLELRRHVNDRQ